MNKTQEPEPTELEKFLAAIPKLLSSKLSILIFIGLFVYLVGFGLLGLVFTSLEPSSKMQLLLGNYTNITSALGASIAAGAGVATVATTSAVLHHVRKNSQRFEELQRSHDEVRSMVTEIHHKSKNS